MSRDPDQLSAETEARFYQFKNLMKAMGIDFILTCTRRTQEEQDALYAQGRSTPGRIVTWTRNSRHISGEAFDIAILKNGKITWAIEDYAEAGKVGELCGLVWGGRWKKPDAAHFQLN